MATTTKMAKKPAATAKTVATKQAPKMKKFNEHDAIPCVSCTAGELLIVGMKSKILYDWHGIGDVVEVEYGDLISMVHSKSKYVFSPRFIIKDDDFVAQNKAVKSFYDNMYSVDDLNEIISKTPSEIKNILPQLPVGAQEAIKNLACGAIDDGTLDSINKIRVFDEFFGTNMMLKITNAQ